MASGFNGIFLMATNPVDIFNLRNLEILRTSKRTRYRIWYFLDSARFRQTIAELVGVDARNVHGYIMGEHGDTEFPVWSHTNVGGLQIYEWVRQNPHVDEEKLVEVFFQVRDAAYEIIAKKVRLTTVSALL